MNLTVENSLASLRLYLKSYIMIQFCDNFLVMKFQADKD